MPDLSRLAMVSALFMAAAVSGGEPKTSAPTVAISGDGFFNLAAVHTACTQDKHVVQADYQLVFPLARDLSRQELDQAKGIYDAVLGPVFGRDMREAFKNVSSADLVKTTNGPETAYGQWSRKVAWVKPWFPMRLISALSKDGELKQSGATITESMDLYVSAEQSPVCR
jgi:hypothetical protein